jgi:hypothetical protein
MICIAVMERSNQGMDDKMSPIPAYAMVELIS